MKTNMLAYFHICIGVTLIDCVNMWKKTEAAKQWFLYKIEWNTVLLCEYR